jgi:hypothetical protein
LEYTEFQGFSLHHVTDRGVCRTTNGITNATTMVSEFNVAMIIFKVTVVKI